VTIAARMLADDVLRVTGRRPELSHKVTPAEAVVAGLQISTILFCRLDYSE